MTIQRALLAAAVLTFSSATQATLIGDTVTCSFSGGGITCSAPSAVVAPVVPEFTLDGGPPIFSVNLEASSISITALINTANGGGISLALGSLDDDSGGNIVGIANFATSNTTGISASDVSFTAHSVTFDLSNSTFDGSASFDLVIARPAAAPEPAPLALLAVGLAALGAIRRRKRA